MTTSSATGFSGPGEVAKFTTQDIHKLILKLPNFYQYSFENYEENLSVVYTGTVFCFNVVGGTYSVNLPPVASVCGKTITIINNTIEDTSNHIIINGPFPYNGTQETLYPGHVLQIVSDGRLWWQINTD